MSERGKGNPELSKKWPPLWSLAATPELVALVKSTPENLSLFKDLSMKIARDPKFLAWLEKKGNFPDNISPALDDLLKETPAASTLESHNWGVHPDLPSPKKAAAALLPAAAAL
jgi:hypothetical protein